jgi:hypothetical protein
MSIPLIELLYEALNTEIGIVIETSDPVALKQKLYKLRRENEEFTRLSFVTSRIRPDREVWIVKNPEETNAG